MCRTQCRWKKKAFIRYKVYYNKFFVEIKGNKMSKNVKIELHMLLIYCIFCVLLFKGFFIDLGAPIEIKYLLDIFNIFLFVIALKKIAIVYKKFRLIILLYLFFILIGTLSTIANVERWESHAIYWLLDCRLFLQFPMFLISCGVLLKKEEVENIFDKLLLFQILNTFLIIYQYFTVEAWDYWMRGDYLNGFFGTSRGGNMYVNVLLLTVTLIVFDRWFHKKMKLQYALLFWISCLIDATLIELKIYYVEIVLCFFMVFFLDNRFNRIKKKKLLIFCGGLTVGIITIPVMISVLYKLYPWMEGSMSISNIIAIASSQNGYTSSGDLNRLTAIGQVYSEIFNKNILDGLIGIGLGNANTGGQMTLFAKIYDATHYSYFQSAYVFIETGIIGLALYVLSFCIIFIQGKKTRYSTIVRIMAVMAIILIIYDEVLKTEGAYIVYFALALAFIDQNPDNYGKELKICVK